MATVSVLAALGLSALASWGLGQMSQPSSVGFVAGVLAVLGGVIGCVGIGVMATSKPVRKFFGAGMVVALLLLTTGCTRINAGHEGIVVHMAGDQRGVSDFPLTTGWVFYWPPSTKIMEYPTYMQTAVWTANSNEGHNTNEEIQFASAEGMAFTADISLSYQLVPEKIPHFYVQFRSDDLDAWTHGFLHNVARDAFQEIAPRYTVEQLYGSKKEEFIRTVRARVDSVIEPYGVKLQQFGYIGNPRPPEAVLTALNNKVKAIQDAQAAQNRVAQIQAEAEQTIARAHGEAQANRELASSISPQLLDWRRLAITESAVAKWNGARPMVEGGGSGLLLNITAPH